MEKCFIVRYQLGSRLWFLIEQNGLTLSTPLETFEQAAQWCREYSGMRCGFARVTADLTEVTLRGGVQ